MFPSFLKYTILIVVFVIFFIGNGNVHLFDWDEINFAECAREMIISGNYAYPTIAYQPFYEKPPLFFWIQTISMKIFGINEFAARFPNALVGLFVILILYRYGKKYFLKHNAYLWPFMYVSGLLPFLYFKSGIIDPWFNFFMFISIVEYYLYLTNKRFANFFISSISLALAVLTKGPVGILIVSFCVFAMDFIFQRNVLFSVLNSLKHLIFVILVTGAYVWYLIQSGNEDFIHEFIRYQVRLFSTEDSGHGGPFWFHVPVLFFGCFPASFFAILRLRKSRLDENKKFSLVMLISLLWVLLIFSIVKTKIVHYSSFCYFPISWFAAEYLNKVLTSGRFRLNFNWIYFFFLFLIMLIVALGILLKYWTSLFSYLINDNMINANRAFLGKDSFGFFLFALFCLLNVTVILIRWNFNYNSLIFSIAVYSLLFISSIFYLVPRIEILSQRGLIEIFKIVNVYDAYTETLNFKSYAYFFYAERMPRHYQNKEILSKLQNTQGEFVSFNHKYQNVLLTNDFNSPQILIYKGVATEDEISQYAKYKVIKTNFGYTLFLKPKIH
jgi:hypothetical protein